jgi:hypothetical protein
MPAPPGTYTGDPETTILMKQDGSPSEWEPIGVPVLALHAQESSCLQVSVEMRRTGPLPSAVNDDEVVRDPPAARVRVEDTPDSGFGNGYPATVFRHAISPTEN